MSFIAELKRRNVIRTAVAYLAAAWLLIQVFESLLPVLSLPDTAMRYVFIVLAIGFVPVMFAAWVFELTPDGLIRDSGEAASVDAAANRRFDRIIIVILVLAVTLFAAHTFIIDPARDAARIEEAARDARSGAFKESFGAKSIAVLPFRNMSADPNQDYFGEGIAEELLNLLAKVEGLRVISRTSSFQFKDSELSVPEIARKLDVATVLEGSVRKSANTIRITAQLIDAGADAHLWSETYDRNLDDIFQIQDEVAAEVVDQLKVTLNVGLPKADRHSAEAYALFLRARDIVNRDDPEQMAVAMELLHRVLEIERDYVDAEVTLAIAYSSRALSAAHDGDFDLAEEFDARNRMILDQAFEKAPDHARLNGLLGWQAWLGDNDFVAAACHFEAALETDPRDYGALLGAQELVRAMGDLDRAIRIGEYTTSRDPMGFWGYGNLGSDYLASGEVEQAIAAFRVAAAISPKANSIHWKLAFALTVNGELEAALEALEKEPHLRYQLQGRALALHDMGDFEGSAAAMEQLFQIAAANPDNPWHWGIARAYAWMGDADNAFRYLEMVEPARLIGEADNPYFARIKDDPRWQAFTEAIDQEAAKFEFNPKLPPEILAIQ